MSIAFENWAHEVTHLLRAVDRVRGAALERLAAGAAPDLVLADCRGDEPLDAFEAGDSAAEYAAFLAEENAQDGDTGYLEMTEM